MYPAERVRELRVPDRGLVLQNASTKVERITILDQVQVIIKRENSKHRVRLQEIMNFIILQCKHIC